MQDALSTGVPPALRRPDGMPSVARRATPRPEDFVAALRAAARSRTGHFALHHLGLDGERVDRSGASELSTEPAGSSAKPVDDLAVEGLGMHLGTVVPKRHARRAVTRSLIKRQIRAAGLRHSARLGSGLWIVRLRAPFPRAEFSSAASTALKRAVRVELERLFAPLAGEAA